MRRLTITAVLVLLAACRATPTLPESAPLSASALTAWVAARAPSDSSLLELPARVVAPPQSSGVIAPPFAARVTRVLVRPGDVVQRGAPLVEVIMPQLCSAAGAYAAAETRLQAFAKRKSALEALRAEGLAKAGDLLEVETRLAEAKAEQQAAQATLVVAGVGPSEAARVLQSGCSVALRAPVQGTVTELHAALGETRDALGPPLVRVVGAGGALRIEARVSHQLPKDARFELVASGGEIVPLVWVARTSEVDSRDGTQLQWFEPSTPSASLLGGTSGRVRVLLPAASKLLIVPATAVQRQGGRTTVLRFDDPQPRRIVVTVIAISGAEALIDGGDGLRVGDRVASDGAIGSAASDGAGL